MRAYTPEQEEGAQRQAVAGVSSLLLNEIVGTDAQEEVSVPFEAEVEVQSICQDNCSMKLSPPRDGPAL